VTDYLEGVRTGAADNGIAILTTGTADGWQIHTTGSSNASARPRLILYSADIGIVNPLDGDFDSNGTVDAADYVVWRNTNGTAEAYGLWRANYGKSIGGGPLGFATLAGGSSAAAVPEPCAAALVLLACLGLIGSRARR